MKNKKSVMFISALLILIFHLWVNVTELEFEKYLRAVSYIGVDMFFFLSAYSMGKRDIDDYQKFVTSRFKSVYLKFIIFAVVAFVYSGWKISRLVKVITGFELLTRGGGAFLWFLPAIMLFYIFVPLLQKSDRKNRKLTIISIIGIWLVLGIVITTLTNYKEMFIFVNRIPIFMVGFYSSRIINEKHFELDNKKKTIYGLMLLILGSVLLYLFGYKNRLNYPIYDLFYVFAMPSSLGLILLSDLIGENRLIKELGSLTLEIYAIQMIFGFKIANSILKLIGKGSVAQALLVNILTFVLVIAIAYLANKLIGLILKKVHL